MSFRHFIFKSDRIPLVLHFCDQVFQSGVNFVFTLVMARIMGIEAFGSVAVAQVVALYVGAFHISLIAEPFSVNFSKFQGGRMRGYIRWVHKMHLFLSFGMAFCVAGVGAGFHLLGFFGVAQVCFCASLAIPAYFTLWHTRRVFYAMDKAWTALLGTWVYAALLVAGLFGVVQVGAVSPVTVMTVFGVAGGVLLLPIAGDVWRTRNERVTREESVEYGRAHWNYAKWHLGGSLMMGLGSFVAYPVLAISGGMAISGGLRLVETLYSPINQGLTAFMLVVMPRLAALRESRRMRVVEHRLRQLQMLFMLPFVFLLTGMVFWGDSVMCWVFGRAQGAGLGWAAVVFGAVVGLRVLFDLGAGMILRIMGETKAFFTNGWVIGVFGGCLVGAAALFGGLIQVLLAKAVVSLIGGCVLVVYARKVMRNHYSHD